MQDTRLSPQHRVLVTGWQAELYFGELEVLIPAIKLVDGHRVQRDLRPAGVRYLYILLEKHEVLAVDGLNSESFLPGTMNASGQLEMQQLFGTEPEALMQTVRHVAKGPGCGLLRAG